MKILYSYSRDPLSSIDSVTIPCSLAYDFCSSMLLIGTPNPHSLHWRYPLGRKCRLVVSTLYKDYHTTGLYRYDWWHSTKSNSRHKAWYWDMDLYMCIKCHSMGKVVIFYISFWLPASNRLHLMGYGYFLSSTATFFSHLLSHSTHLSLMHTIVFLQPTMPILHWTLFERIWLNDNYLSYTSPTLAFAGSSTFCHQQS